MRIGAVIRFLGLRTQPEVGVLWSGEPILEITEILQIHVVVEIEVKRAALRRHRSHLGAFHAVEERGVVIQIDVTITIAASPASTSPCTIVL